MAKAKLFKSGKKLTDADLDNLEVKVGCKLPASYRNFMLASNGRDYGNKSMTVNGPLGKPVMGSPIQFFTLQTINDTFDEWAAWPPANDPPPPYMLPIGNVLDGDLGTIFLSLATYRYGSVFVIDWGHEGEPGASVGDPSVEYTILLDTCAQHNKVASNFQAIVDGIAPDPDDDDQDQDTPQGRELLEYIKQAQDIRNRMSAGSLIHATGIEMLMALKLKHLGNLPGMTSFEETDDSPAPAHENDFSDEPEQAKDNISPGGPIAPDELAAIEKTNRWNLPDDYRAFIIAQNGGYGDGVIKYSNRKEAAHVLCILPIDKPWRGRTSVVNYAQSLRHHCRLPATLVPVGYGTSAQDLFLSLDPSTYGHLYSVAWQPIRKNPTLWPLVQHTDPAAPNPALCAHLEAHCKVADSFEQALQKLKVRRK